MTAPSPLAAALLLPIGAYRRFLSPALTPRCRYYPSCSAYAAEAIHELGAIRGTLLAIWRVLRCNPFSAGGVDSLAERRLFRKNRVDERVETA
ncbi:MAG: membrane protein insertion efficiency factor YidD [Solirubrobacterales bacterium]